MNETIVTAAETIDQLEGRYLLFNIAETRYGVPLSYVLEIINVQSITFIPGIVHYVKGIINLRGKVVPIIDVRLKLGMEEREYDDKTCIIVLDVADMHIGIIVDSVFEVVNAGKDQLSQPPKTNNTIREYLSSVLELDQQVVLNIDCAKFFKEDTGMVVLL